MNAAIIGVGCTEFSSDSGRSEHELAVEAIRFALTDAGLEPRAVDGIVKYSVDRNTISALIRALGVPDLKFFAEVPFGGNAACGTVAQAAAAVDSGLANYVVCFRALNGRSGTRLGRGERHFTSRGDELLCSGEAVPGGVYAAPFGLLAPAQVMALWARRYANNHGLNDDRLAVGLGTVAITQRDYAQSNPRAVTRGHRLGWEEYLAGRMIAEPLRIYDVCRETDGAAAVVVGRPRGDGREARVLAASQHLFQYGEPVPVYPSDLTRTITPTAVTELFGTAGVAPNDVRVAEIYDATSLSVLLALEDFGFCGRGEAIDFVAAGNLGPAGRLPTNTHGGLLSEGYIHGMNTVVEAVQQVRGLAANQLADAAPVLVTSRLASLLLAR